MRKAKIDAKEVADRISARVIAAGKVSCVMVDMGNGGGMQDEAGFTATFKKSYSSRLIDRT
jgi:hypothetical protein